MGKSEHWGLLSSLAKDAVVEGDRGLCARNYSQGVGTPLTVFE